MKRLFTLVLAMAMVITLSACGEDSPEDAAANWPDHEVRLIVPYAEGGGSHKAAMEIKETSDRMGIMKSPFIAVCMPNAATLEGQEEVLNASPDGYTILLHHNAMLNGYALGKQDFTYDSFRMLGQVYETPLVIGVRSDFPADTLDELVAEIHANPGVYKWTWAGSGGNTHFASYVFYNAAGIDVSEITPCLTKGDSDSVVQVIGGTADIVIAQINAVEEYVKSGDMKLLGNSSESAITVAGQEVPSWTEEGYDGVYNLRLMAFLPKDTPDEIVAVISDVFEQIVTSQDFIDAMAEESMTASWLPEAEAIAAFEEEAESANTIAKQILEDE